MAAVAGSDHERLSELIAEADGRALAVSAVAAVDRSLPVLAEAAGIDLPRELLGPTRDALRTGGDWLGPLRSAKERIDEAVECAGGLDEDTLGDERFELADLVAQMVGHVPDEPSDEAIAEWADGCANAALDVRQALDALADDEPDGPTTLPAGRLPDTTPLEAAELSRQISILTALAAPAPDLAAVFRLSDDSLPETDAALAVLRQT